MTLARPKACIGRASATRLSLGRASSRASNMSNARLRCEGRRGLARARRPAPPGVPNAGAAR
jgi:hypothetical protein